MQSIAAGQDAGLHAQGEPEVRLRATRFADKAARRDADDLIRLVIDVDRTADDVRGAIALYGGKLTPRRQPATCPVYPPIDPPGGLRATYDPAQVGVELAFSRPRPPVLPRFLEVPDRRSAGGYAFTRAAGRCPPMTALARARRLPWSVTVGAVTQIYDAVPRPGRHCYAVWALDQLGVASSRPATAWVTIPGPSPGFRD